MNTADIIVLAAVGAAIVLAVIFSFHSRKKRGGGCSCGCSCCKAPRSASTLRVSNPDIAE